MNNEQHEQLDMNEMDRETRLTAYALGELSPELMEEVELELQNDADAQALVESVRSTAELLSEELAGESGPGLTDSQRERVLLGQDEESDVPVVETTSVAKESIDRSSRAWWTRSGLIAAACVVLAAAAGMLTKLPGPIGKSTSELEYAVDQRTPTPTPSASITTLPSVVDDSAYGLNGLPGLTIAGEDEESLVDFAKVEQDPQERTVLVFDMAAASAAKESRFPWTSGGKSETAEGTVPGRRKPSAGGTRDRASRAAPGPGGGFGGGGMGGHAPPGPGAAGMSAGASPSAAPEAINRWLYDDDPGTNPSTETLSERLAGEGYDALTHNDFIRPLDQAKSTFSIDVDTASYSNVRRILRQGGLPPAGAVRIEEMINFFAYDYPQPADEHPFSISVDSAPAPWNPANRLVRLGLQGKDVDVDMRPATNLVFLVDVSGSMNQPAKLPLVKQSLTMLVDRLNADDRIAIVTYAGQSGVALESTYCYEKDRIKDAIHAMRGGGSTNGAAGIDLAYEIASQHFIHGGVNRVILATDGDFNVGRSSHSELLTLIEEKRTSGVFLSVLGYGSGNFQDGKMETITNAGNGVFAYIDGLPEARRMLVDNLAGTLVTIAKDVKIQVEFNPAFVGSYRLIGYENRVLATRDFDDDTKDAGEIGAGHSVTALYELTPAEAIELGTETEIGRFQRTEIVQSDALMSIGLRYKQPDGEVSQLIELEYVDSNESLDDASPDFKFAAAVAAYGMILRQSPHKGTATMEQVLDLATAGLAVEPSWVGLSGRDGPANHRGEFIELVELARMHLDR